MSKLYVPLWSVVRDEPPYTGVRIRAANSSAAWNKFCTEYEIQLKARDPGRDDYIVKQVDEPCYQPVRQLSLLGEPLPLFGEE